MNKDFALPTISLNTLIKALAPVILLTATGLWSLNAPDPNMVLNWIFNFIFQSILKHFLGLKMEIFINQSEYLATSLKAGIYSLIHAFNETIIPENAGLQVPTGFSVAMAVRQITFKRLGAPYGSCVAEIGDLPYYYNSSYNVEVKFLIDFIINQKNYRYWTIANWQFHLRFCFEGGSLKFLLAFIVFRL